MDAVTAAEKLAREGYRNVSAMEGGLKRWVALGFAVVGDDPTLLEAAKQHPKFTDHNYAVDVAESRIEWIGRNPNTTHYGTIGLSKGEIRVKNGQIGGSFELDMKSIRNINLEGDPLQPVLIDHLLSDDFFFVKMFPTSAFTITSATPINEAGSSDPNFEIKGFLKLRGVKKDIHFHANASGEQCGEVKIEAHFDLDRTRWGIIYGSTRFFEHLGMHLVFDYITIQLRLITK
jgi:polyisoprenoid-binding protein YceI